MRSQTGSVGLVPACYMEPVDKGTANPNETQAVVESVDRAIEAIHVQAAHAGGFYTHEQRTNLRKLLEHRKRLHDQSGKISPVKASHSSELHPSGVQNKSSVTAQDPPAQPRRPAPTLPPEKEKKEKKQESTKRRPAPVAPTAAAAAKQPNETKGEVSSEDRRSTPPVPVVPQRTDLEPVQIRPGIAAELLELLRINTGLSYDKSYVAVYTVVSHIQESVPGVSEAMTQIIQDLASQKESRSEDEEALLQSHDGQQLIGILDELTEHKEDSQQRTWAVHEDEGIIHKLLKNLLNILLDADPSVCRAVLKQDDYEYVNMLVVYFQMEERRSLRQQLVEIFGCMCGLEKEILSQLLCSVLPTELAIEIMNRKHDVLMQCHCALLLTMIFSTGESVPFTLYDQVNESFVDFVIGVIESAGGGEHGEELVDALVPLILAFNQHFVDFQSNIVMRVLASRQTAKTFSEKIMLLINREEDPTAMFQYPRACPDSVLKFLTDIFSSQETSGFFYTSDMMILIEIVLRQLADLSPGAGMRTEHISLLHQILMNSNYSEHKHQANELLVCLKRISKEEDKESEQDRLIVQEILKNSAKYF
ncbi:hypothetical protein ACROYT_G034256 [Oculina patagonica]